MKILVGALLAIILDITGYYLLKTSKKNHSLVPIVSKILWVGFSMVFFYVIALLVEVEKVALFAYSAYYVAIGWLFYFLLYFSLEYTGNILEKYIRKKFMLVLLIIDSLLILSNNFTQMLFTLNWTPVFENDSLYKPAFSSLFYANYSFWLMLMVFCLVSLVHRFFTAPDFYRMKYMLIALIILAMIGLNIHGLGSPLDFSIIGYTGEVICIYYCAFVYTPQRLLPKTLAKVTENMSVGVIAMDLEGKKIYNNKLGEEYLSSENPLVDNRGIDLEAWCREWSDKHAKEEEIEETFYRNAEPVSFKIQLQRLVDNKKQLQGSYFILQDRTEEIRELKKKQHLATHDRLTDLYNKEFFYEEADRYILEHPGEELLMVCTDIKDFKMINDFFGSRVGDAVLQNYADRLRSYENRFAVYGRLGNDNFAVLMKKSEFEENLFDMEAQAAFDGAVNSDITFNMITYAGVYEIVEKCLMVSVMCGRAKMAINTIKGNRQKRVAYYDNVLRDNILLEQELIGDLQHAITEGQLQMYLQPQTTVDGKVLGAEALIRWNHPKKGVIMPTEFIPILENNGLITDVDKYIWELACKQLRKWKDEERKDVYISVNISPRDFYFLDIYNIFMDLAEKYEIEPKRLKLEITETAVMMDFARQLELIDKLRKAGFIVEMDDFGSAYSSLNMLKDIQVDILKIDMAFLQKNQDTDRGKKILQMVIDLSTQLGMPVISEGVETPEQLSFLAEMGCNMFQGYYFARPMAAEQFEEKYL